MASHGPVSVGNISGGSVTTIYGNPVAGEYPTKIRIESSAYWRNNSTVNVKFRLRVCDVDNPNVYVQWGETDTVAPGYSYNKQYLNNEYDIPYDSRLVGKKIGFTFLTDFNDATFLWGGGTITITTDMASYSITKNVSPSGAGTISSPSGTSAKAGSTVSLSQTPASDYEFVKWQLNGSDLSGSSFTMPANSVTITAVYREAHKTVKYCDNGTFKECIPYYCPSDGASFVEVEPWYCDSDGSSFKPCAHT